MKKILATVFILACALLGCNKDESVKICITENFFNEYPTRNFQMGFSTWIYAPSQESKDDTYRFIGKNSDIYSEHIDDKIPWDAWINNTVLPAEFTDDIASRASNKISNSQLVVSIGLLNGDRSNLAEDFDENPPSYTALNDQKIEDAYFKHVKYIIDALQPNYLVIAIEANELKIKSPSKWDNYKSLIAAVKARVKQANPNLKISESITLHTLYQPDVSNPEEYITEIVDYANQLDFVSISYYPFFKNQHSKAEFQQAFDFLHSKINKPIAFVETSHIAEDLSVTSFDLFIPGNTCEQNTYLETLLTNAQKENYEFVIWWAHRDFDALWNTFPEEAKDLGKIWRNTGLLDDQGNERPAYSTWKHVFDK